MGFYALLDDHAALARLDGWLVSTMKQALSKRCKIMGTIASPIKVPKMKALISGQWYLASVYSGGGFYPDTRMPSFVRAWAAARKYYYAFGLEGVEAPRYVSYY
jgi:RNA-directed DNA polymerase